MPENLEKQFIIALPADVREALQLTPGDDVFFEIRRGTIILRKSKDTPATKETTTDAHMHIKPFITHEPGKIIDGRFEVLRHLGDGFRSSAHLCREIHNNQSVVIKTCHPDLAKDEWARARWIREMRASESVSHPNVLRVLDYFSDEQTLFSITEYVEGQTLADLQERKQQIAIDAVLSILIQLCAGLDAIHRSGCLHRDIKHESVLLSYKGEIKITGCGSIARTGIAHSMNKDNGLIGTVGFVAPECLEHGIVDKREEIYAIGIIAYELLTDRPPFRGESIIQTTTQRLSTDPPPPELYRSDCPKALSQAILKALARNPDERYQTAQEMLNDLREFS